MQYLSGLNNLEDINEFQTRWKAYYQYLEEISGYLPTEARYFAQAGWHWDHIDHRCPHDSWLETLEIKEYPTNNADRRRRVDIHLLLLGPYHDGYISLYYPDVRCYRVGTFESNPKDSGNCSLEGHGDWLIDEIVLSKDGYPVHEIQFDSCELNWYIEAHNIVYEWRPIQGEACSLDRMREV